MNAPRGGETIEHAQLVSRSQKIPPVSAQAFLTAHPPPRVQWTSPDGIELIGVGAAAHLTATGPQRFRIIRDHAQTLFNDADHEGPSLTRPRLIGGFSFTDDHTPTPPWTDFPAAAFVLPHIQLTTDGTDTWLTITHTAEDASPATVETELNTTADSLTDLPDMQPTGDPPGVSNTHPTPDEANWHTQVTEAIDQIKRGELRKIVLARALTAELGETFNPGTVIERLRHQYADCYRFLLEFTDDAAFFGAPPERFVHRSGTTVTTEALAGSVERGDTPAEDDELATELRNSPKHQEEHGMVVEAIVNQLQPLGSVTIGEQGIRRLANIQHLQTPITADLTTDRHVLDLVKALHPTPAVGGLPPKQALETISHTEAFDRGWYAAPVGWFDGTGDGEFAVAIRSAVGAHKEVTLYAGNGIVADSDPAAEWAELQPKYRPILDTLQ